MDFSRTTAPWSKTHDRYMPATMVEASDTFSEVQYVELPKELFLGSNYCTIDIAITGTVSIQAFGTLFDYDADAANEASWHDISEHFLGDSAITDNTLVIQAIPERLRIMLKMTPTGEASVSCRIAFSS